MKFLNWKHHDSKTLYVVVNPVKIKMGKQPNHPY